MLTDEEKLRILQEILESPDFKGSRRFRDLLTFLVQQSMAGISPKEISIGIQVFGKDKDFDSKEDATIRVYVNTLRKKIEHYYLTSPKEHRYRLTIPVGHYRVEFLPCEPAINGNSRRLKPWVAAALILGIALGTGVGTLVTRTSSVPASRSGGVFREFLRPEGRSTLFLLGDYFFLYEHSDSVGGGDFVRKISINSSAEYRQVTRADPAFARRYVPSDISFLRPSSAWGLSELLPILDDAHDRIFLKLASKVSVDEFRTHNVIFIGSVKALHDLDELLGLYGVRYNTSEGFSLAVQGGDSLVSFTSRQFKGGSYEKDYAVIVKAPLPEGGTVLLVLGQGDAAVIAGCRALADDSLMTTITAGGDDAGPLYFRLVLETEGLNQTDFNKVPRWFDRLDPSTVFMGKKDTALSSR